jgi:non-ribosomal peptide synthetase component F
MPLVEKLHVRYRDYVALERQAIESEESRNFWELLLAGYSPTPGPFSGPQNNPESNSILGQRAIELNEREWTELRELAASLRVPLKTVLLAAHLKTLSLLSGNSDVITGVVMNGRPEVQGGERMLGLFLNVVPVRLKIVLGSWIDLIRATLVVEQRIMPHRWYPMAMLKRSHGEGRELFETAFTYLNFHVYKQLRGNGQSVIVERGGFARQSFPFQVAFEVTPGVESIRSFVEYSLDRVRQTDGERIPAYYAQVLRSMIDSPTDLHSAGICLSDAERRQILEKWNQTETENEMAAGVLGMFAAQVKRTPQSPAILFDEQQLSYTELYC